MLKAGFSCRVTPSRSQPTSSIFILLLSYRFYISALTYFAVTAKTDGRERLTVTDTKPAVMTSSSSSNSNNSNNTTDLTNNNNNNQNNNSNNNEIYLSNGLLSHAPNANDPNDCVDADLDVDADADVDAGCGCTEQSLAEILDPELQPEPPIPNNVESQAIYRDHRHMAKEYLSVDTNLYYAQDFKEKLILQMDRFEREQKQELLRKIKDKVCKKKTQPVTPDFGTLVIYFLKLTRFFYTHLYRRGYKASTIICSSSGRSCQPHAKQTLMCANSQRGSAIAKSYKVASPAATPWRTMVGSL